MAEYKVASARELLDHLTLNDVGSFELHGVRGMAHEGRRRIVGPGGPDDLEVIEQENSLNVFWPKDGGQVLVRLSFLLETTMGTLQAGVQGEWATGYLSQEDISPAAEEDWLNQVAVMALVPYLRAAISDIAVRVFGANVTLPVIRQGEMTFNSQRNSDTDS